MWEVSGRFGQYLVEMATSGLGSLGKYLLDGFNSFGIFVLQTFGNIGQAIWSGLQWIWSGLTWFGSQLWTAISSFGNWIYNIFNNLFSFQIPAFNALARSTNSWLNNIVSYFRQKIVNIVKADITLWIGWQGINKLGTDFSLKSLLGAFTTPIAGLLAGEIFGSVLDAMLPHTDLDIKIIPEISLPTISPLTLTIPSVEYTPTPSAPPSGAFITIYDKTLVISKPTYEVQVNAGISIDAPEISKPTYEVQVNAGIDKTLSIDEPTYEVVVA